MQKNSTEQDSSASTRHDSLSSSRRDSIGSLTDHSLITTQEHIVNTFIVPGVSLNMFATLDSLAKHPKVIISADGKDTLKLGYDPKTGKVSAESKRAPVNQQQTIDRTTTEHKDVTQQSKVSDSKKTAVKDSKKIKTQKKTDSKNTDATRTGLSVPWEVWLGAAVFVGIAVFLLIKYLKRKAMPLI